jgi:hypothetical protein
MREMLVVIPGTVDDMLDHSHPTTPIAAQEIPFGKSFQQSFGLIEPRSMGGCE